MAPFQVTCGKYTAASTGSSLLANDETVGARPTSRPISIGDGRALRGLMARLPPPPRQVHPKDLECLEEDLNLDSFMIGARRKPYCLGGRDALASAENNWRHQRSARGSRTAGLRHGPSTTALLSFHCGSALVLASRRTGSHRAACAFSSCRTARGRTRSSLVS